MDRQSTNRSQEEADENAEEFEDVETAQADLQRPSGSKSSRRSIKPSANPPSAHSSKKETPRSPGPGSPGGRNPAADGRNLRRIIAEDPEWNLATVPLLSELCLRQLVKNFPFNASVLQYREKSIKQRPLILKRIDTNLPLKISAPLIHEESFWERACKARWRVCDVKQHGGSWKRLYLETNMQEIIENFIPERTDSTRLKETLPLSAPFVQRLIIKQLLPPVKENKKEDDSSDVESDNEDGPVADHIDLAIVLQGLPYLTDLRLTYEVKNCGMNFEWSLFQFTSKDCLQLAKAVAEHKVLKVFHLSRSRVDDDKCRVLISHLLNHPSLMELNLSNNSIGDRGARALGKLLNNNCPQLVHLNLSNNCIRAIGAQAIAHALTKNTILFNLNLRLNRLLDDGGQAIAKALLTNQTLKELNLAANDMSEPTAAALAEVLTINQTLTILDFSNNRFGPDGGKQLQEGMEENWTVQHMDLRFTECGQESEYCISQIIERNQERQRLETELSVADLPDSVRRFKNHRLRVLTSDTTFVTRPKVA